MDLKYSLPNEFIQLPLYKRVRKGAIAGGVLGGVVLIVAIGALILFWRRRRLRQMAAQKKEDITPYIGVGPPVPAGHDSLHTQNTDIDNTSFDNGDIRPFTGLPHPDVNPNAKGAIPPLLPRSTDLQPLTPHDSSSKSALRNTVLGPSQTFLLTNSESRTGTHGRDESTASLNMSSVALGPSSPVQQELIVEVQQLRREMEELRARQGVDEPPPLYRDSDVAVR